MTWDRFLLDLLNHDLACPALDVVMAAVSILAAPAVLVVVSVALSLCRVRAARALLAVVILSTLLCVGLQFLLGRTRPSAVRTALPTPPFPSFPSGHAAAALGWALLSTRFWPRSRALVSVGALVVGVSRVYLGHHYPSDVLAGAVLGAGVATTAYGTLYLGDCGGRPRWAWMLWGQLAVVVVAGLSAHLGLLNLKLLAWPGADKALHFLLFGLLAFLAVGWWAERPAAAVIMAVGFLAAVDELIQWFSPRRGFDWLDLGATAAGAVVFGCLARHVLQRQRVEVPTSSAHRSDATGS